MKSQITDSVQKGKHGEVYTTEKGFTLAKAESGEIGWIVGQVKPAERRIKVVFRNGNWFMWNACDS